MSSAITAGLWLMVALVVAFQVPSSIAAADELALKKVGEARLRVFLWSIYNSRLYTPTGSYREGDRPLRLDIEYLINVRRAALVERTGDEWDAMGRSHPQQEAWLTRLTELWPDIFKKDVLSVVLDDANRSTFYHNGEQLGRIDDPDFGPQFVDIWLSEDSTRPELREALLGDSDAN
ncbi:MAG: chalcone isomerase family protein [Pseudomonadota bacterium]